MVLYDGVNYRASHSGLDYLLYLSAPHDISLEALLPHFF